MKFEKLAVTFVNPKDLIVFEYSRNLFPKLEGEAYDFLKADIKENGIRTPLEITKGKLILCGHERHRIALDLDLKEVPVIYFGNDEVVEQKIRCIKDNLARKAVDVRTKVRCYGELRELYGLKRGGDRRSEDFKQSSDGLKTDFMSHVDMAKEVGLKESTMERALKIEESDLPEQVKDATFKGKLGIEPTVKLLNEPEDVRKQVVSKIMEELKQGSEHIVIQDLLNDVKDKDCEQSNTMREFLSHYKEALENIPENALRDKTEAAIELFKQLLEANKIVCPKCGENHLKWSCGHAF